MGNVQIQIDEAVAKFLGDSHEQIERRACEMIVLELYRRNEISARWGAKMLGMEFLAFARWSGELGIPYFRMTAEEWQQEFRALERLERLDAQP